MYPFFQAHKLQRTDTFALTEEKPVLDVLGIDHRLRGAVNAPPKALFTPRVDR